MGFAYLRTVQFKCLALEWHLNGALGRGDALPIFHLTGRMG